MVVSSRKLTERHHVAMGKHTATALIHVAMESCTQGPQVLPTAVDITEYTIPAHRYVVMVRLHLKQTVTAAVTIKRTHAVHTCAAAAKLSKRRAALTLRAAVKAHTPIPTNSAVLIS